MNRYRRHPKLAQFVKLCLKSYRETNQPQCMELPVYDPACVRVWSMGRDILWSVYCRGIFKTQNPAYEIVDPNVPLEIIALTPSKERMGKAYREEYGYATARGAFNFVNGRVLKGEIK